MRRVVAVGALVIASLAGAGVRAQPEGAPKRYSLKAMDSTFATPYSRKVASGSAIPFDKTYAELAEEEKRLVRSQYENMAETDEPPFPLAGLAPLYRAVADGQQRRLAEGELSVIVDVDASGQALQAAVYKTPDPALASYVAGVLLKQKYKPAVCGGQACAMQFPFRIKLNVE